MAATTRPVSGRRWIIAAIIVFALLAAAFLVVRWALDPLLLRGLAESRLSAALGQPVHIGTVRVSFLPSPGVYGTDILVGDGTRAGGPSLDIHAIRLHPQLSTIFRRPIVIDRVAIEGLTLNAVRDVGGNWLLPLPSTRGGASTTSEASLDVAEVALKAGRLTILDRGNGPGRGRRVTPIESLDATVHRAGGLTRLDDLTASVGTSKVAGTGVVGTDGLRLTLRWTDLRAADLPLVFALVGTPAPAGLSIAGRNPLAIDLRVDAKGEPSASGRIAADRAALGTLAMTSFQSPIGFARNRLTLDPMSFRAYSGTGRARLTASVASSPVAWTLDANFQHLDIDQFVSANTTAKGKLSGIGALDARLRGTSRAPVERTVAGSAAVDIANGAIRDFPLIAALYSALKLGGTSDRDLHFQRLSGTFAIANAQATTNDLVAQSGEVTLAAAGAIGFDQSLAMKGTAAFSAARSDAFVRSIRELSALRNANGEIEVPFSVSGTASAPRFSIDVAGLARRGLENQLKRSLGDRLRDLLKKKK